MGPLQIHKVERHSWMSPDAATKNVSKEGNLDLFDLQLAKFL